MVAFHGCMFVYVREDGWVSFLVFTGAKYQEAWGMSDIKTTGWHNECHAILQTVDI